MEPNFPIKFTSFTLVGGVNHQTQKFTVQSVNYGEINGFSLVENFSEIRMSEIFIHIGRRRQRCTIIKEKNGSGQIL